jgi:hypothetical protein
MRTQKYIVTEQSQRQLQRGIPGLSIGDDIVKGSFFLSCNLVQSRAQPSKETQPAHTHDCEEIMGFFGTNFDDWRDLAGEVELWLDGRKNLLTRTCLVYVPAGMSHCPMNIRRADRPMFLFSTGPAPRYLRLPEKERPPGTPFAETGKYIITEQTQRQASRGSRGLSISGEVIPGINFFWQGGWMIPGVAEGVHDSFTSHTHDYDEVIGFFGTDPENWQELGGEVELWLDGEKRMLSRSFLIFVPKGMAHCPMIMRAVNKPIFHFTTGPGSMYIRQDPTS